jgi:hypothetical protein
LNGEYQNISLLMMKHTLPFVMVKIIIGIALKTALDISIKTV